MNFYSAVLATWILLHYYVHLKQGKTFEQIIYLEEINKLKIALVNLIVSCIKNY
jgi:hypothetical protein